jgi:hypothetical protein
MDLHLYDIVHHDTTRHNNKLLFFILIYFTLGHYIIF